jgi:beta-galactosidase
MKRKLLLIQVLCAMLLSVAGFCEDAVALPAGVKAVWELEKAQRETTPTRERVCINGLWRWQPAPPALKKPAPGETLAAAEPPTGKWGYMKVPGAWPGAHGQSAGETQRVYAHPDWKPNEQVCWYQREISIPSSWKSRDTFIDINWLQSIANVYLDNRLIGNVGYPGGKLNITAACKPGEKQVLSICVAALPLSKEMTVFMKGDLTATGQATVTRRGLCGDVFLESTPAKARVSDLKIEPSVRNWELGVNAGVANLAADQEYRFKGEIFDGEKKVHSFQSAPFKASDASSGRFAFTTPWKPEKLWDTNATANMYDVKLSLMDGTGAVVDAYFATRFGFREFWLDGKDFKLNGSRYHLIAYPYDGALLSVYNASYAGAKEALERVKAAGFNFIYAHNYDAHPGSNLSYEETMRAADDVGILFSFTMGITDPAHTEWFVRQASGHPSVVMYAISHNNYGISEDGNPDLIHSCPDFTADANDHEKRADGKQQEARKREALITKFDRTRPIYHHGGNISDMATPNMYLNFVPPQEVSDWFATWAEKSKKPVFPTEFGNAVDADFTMFRGYDLSANGEVTAPLEDAKLGRNGGMRKQGSYFYGSALRTEYHLPGWGAQFRGDIAYQLTANEITNLRAEADQWKKKTPGWKFWSYPINVNTPYFDAPNERDVQAMYVNDNWPAFRTLGVSGTNIWYYSELFRLKDNAWQKKPGVTMRDGWTNNDRDQPVFPIATDWDALQKPGYSCDWRNAPPKYQEVEAGFPFSHSKEDWVEVGNLTKAWLRVTRPAFAYIANKAAHITGKDHNFYPSEAVEKTVVVINDTRAPLTADCEWKSTLPGAAGAKKQVKIETGEQARLPLKFDLPADAKPGEYEISLSTKFSTGDVQDEKIRIHILPALVKPKLAQPVALFDPAGKTKKMLGDLGVSASEIKADAKPTTGVLIIGKDALSAEGPAPDLAAVRDGLKVIAFEQNLNALQSRLGFRTVEYGLRQVYPRFPAHALLADTSAANWSDWRGDSGANLSELKLLFYTPAWKYCSELLTNWAGLTVNRSWRGTTYGTVSSIFMEKPHRGDFMPVLEGGFSLQYAPLMEYREGKGVVIFCQVDVSNRAENDPAAKTLVRNILEYAEKWQPAAERKARYIGDAAGKAHLEKTGIAAATYEGGALNKDDVLIVGPGAALAVHAAAIGEFVKQGGNVLAIGLTDAEANAGLPIKVTTKLTEHVAAYFPAPDAKSLFAGINPAGVHSREPRKLALFSASDDVEILGNGILAKAKSANVVFCQMVPWTYDLKDMHNLKTSYRHSTELLNRLLANMGVRGTTGLLARFGTPARADGSLYVDTPVEADDPYRQYGW